MHVNIPTTITVPSAAGCGLACQGVACSILADGRRVLRVYAKSKQVLSLPNPGIGCIASKSLLQIQAAVEMNGEN